jgi:hypothetical protein
MTGDQKSESSKQPPEARKPYKAPELVSWGSLREMTLSVGTKGASDGAKKGSNRTG